MDYYEELMSADEFYLIRKDTGESVEVFLVEGDAQKYVADHVGTYYTCEKVAERLMHDGVRLESGETLFRVARGND